MRAEDRYDSLFQFYAEQSGLSWQRFGADWRLLKAQAMAESALNPDAKSKVGAAGLAQFMARTWEEWRDGTPGIQEAPPTDLVLLDPRDPEDAIRAQAAYMAWLLRRFEGDIRAALAAYNWGIGRVKSAMETAGEARPWLPLAPAETQAYVPKVLRIMGDLIAQDPPPRSAGGGATG